MLALGATDAAYRFADLTAKLIARRVVAHPFWTIDQLALLIVSRYLMTADPDFRAIDLTAATGLSFDACFTSNGTAQEKQTMRRAAVAA
jgi:hypothetical protein